MRKAWSERTRHSAHRKKGQMQGWFKMQTRRRLFGDEQKRNILDGGKGGKKERKNGVFCNWWRGKRIGYLARSEMTPL